MLPTRQFASHSGADRISLDGEQVAIDVTRILRRSAANMPAGYRQVGRIGLVQIASQRVTAIHHNQIETPPSGRPNAFRYCEVRITGGER
jgi:hypothetical protein